MKPDLEVYLELPVLARDQSHRKPQSAVYNYMIGNLNKSKLESFCAMVSKLMMDA